VVAGFTPWNGAFNLAWRTIALPMAFGNTVNVVTHAPGEAADIADAFFESAAVRCINFTGSAGTARILAEKARRSLKPIVLELGGYNRLLVLSDADQPQAVDATVFGAFFHQGQICMNTRKVLVERPIHEEFVAQVVAKTQALPAGDPTDPTTIIGPLINDRAVRQMRERIKDVTDRGARLLTGGHVGGRMFSPTIFADVPSDAIVHG
jgi:acyl-CoA reductase-like NAD-dependent aldehyde dehydrogenase